MKHILIGIIGLTMTVVYSFANMAVFGIYFNPDYFKRGTE